MIESGEKKEEYRQLKYYWICRLENKHFDIVEFRNGYGKKVPSMQFHIESITIGFGNPKWGARPGRKYFIIKLGKRIW